MRMWTKRGDIKNASRPAKDSIAGAESPPPENGLQYECFEMTVKSGMGVLGALKALRKIGMRAMVIGERSLEEWVEWDEWRDEYRDDF
jgi:hypothetical protein